MARIAGQKNRNYPSLPLAEALAVARAIEDEASGMTVSRLTLAELLDKSPGSSVFRELVASSRFYGLTDGGINSNEFSLTSLGAQAVGADEVALGGALKAAVLNVPPYSTFFKSFNGKKVPSPGPLKEFLVNSAAIAPERLDEVIEYLIRDARTAGFLKTMKGGDYVELTGVPEPPPAANGEASTEDQDAEGSVDETGHDQEPEDATPRRDERDESPERTRAQRNADGQPRKVFIAHGKNRVPLDQLKTALDQFKVRYAVAVDEPNQGRPISKKVAELMENNCSSGIFIFTADERFLREEPDGTTVEVWRPSENVVYELGAASILYDNRIVIFKEESVSFPSDFSDLGYIKFEKDQLVGQIGSLFQELVALDILEVRAKG